MNTTIKFRGRNKQHNWHYGYYYYKNGKHWIIRDNDPNNVYVYVYGERVAENKIEYEVDPETIGQATGEYDANGEEIYEGDLLQVICNRCENVHHTEVKRTNCTLYVDVCDAEYDNTSINYAMDLWKINGDEVSVIKKVHDNYYL